MSELLPCPHCNGEAETYHGTWWYAECSNGDCPVCPELEKAYNTEAEAIAAWNTRAGEEARIAAAVAAERARWYAVASRVVAHGAFERNKDAMAARDALLRLVQEAEREAAHER